MRQQKLIAMRMRTDELKKLDRLVRNAGLSRSATIRALINAVENIEPQPPKVTFIDAKLQVLTE